MQKTASNSASQSDDWATEYFDNRKMIVESLKELLSMNINTDRKYVLTMINKC